ncbi:MAG TPA: GAF domain-containing protein [Methylomirabilota bacterium]|nr:GAF domain-containing protein [Methylomirabilota bacterium]
MNTVLVLATDEPLRARIIRSLAPFSTFEARTEGEALRTLRLVDIDVILRESAGPAGALATFVAAAKDVAPQALVVAVGSSGEDEDSADFTVPDGFTARELEAVLRQALDRQRLAREVAASRTARPAASAMRPADDETPWDSAALARVLRGFTGVLAVGFDIPRALGLFIESIGELVRPTRVALLRPGALGREFRIVAERGLAPQLVQGIRLSPNEGLIRWLAVQGRPATTAEIADPEILRELKLLQAVVAVPLLAHGELVAVLALGQPVFGATYGRRELQTLFDLAAHLATVLRDITLHHQLAREKEFTERILSHMSSGVVTIGRDQKVGTLNRRAEEILDLSASAVVGQDLRILPSPLGDMLYDTLASGRPLARTEIQLALRRLALEVSTYAVRDEEGDPLGAVLVFEDLTAQKELAAQRRAAEQFQLLTRVVARIADEIKNPLVSINTFIELIGERYDDPDFRRHFSAVVRRDVRRLVEVFEKLAGLVTEGELNFSIVDAREVVGRLVEAIDPTEEGAGRHLQIEVASESVPQPIKVDVAQLRKALSYLIRYLAHNSPAEQAKVALSVGPHEDEHGGADVRILVGSRTASVTAERLQRLFDPVEMVQESLIDVGPAVAQRLIEALGGRLRTRQTRHEISFLVTLPAAS